MLITNEDLYDLLNVKVGDKIKVIGGEGIKYGIRLEIVENGKFSFGPYDVGHALSKLIDVEFEKVPIKFFEPIQYETAIRRMADEEETYMKYNDELLICGFTFHSKHKKMRSIILSKNDNTFVTEKEISFFEALKYNFYKEV